MGGGKGFAKRFSITHLTGGGGRRRLGDGSGHLQHSGGRIGIVCVGGCKVVRGSEGGRDAKWLDGGGRNGLRKKEGLMNR